MKKRGLSAKGKGKAARKRARGENAVANGSMALKVQSASLHMRAQSLRAESVSSMLRRWDVSGVCALLRHYASATRLRTLHALREIAEGGEGEDRGEDDDEDNEAAVRALTQACARLLPAVTALVMDGDGEVRRAMRRLIKAVLRNLLRTRADVEPVEHALAWSLACGLTALDAAVRRSTLLLLLEIEGNGHAWLVGAHADKLCPPLLAMMTQIQAPEASGPETKKTKQQEPTHTLVLKALTRILAVLFGPREDEQQPRTAEEEAAGAVLPGLRARRGLRTLHACHSHWVAVQRLGGAALTSGASTSATPQDSELDDAEFAEAGAAVWFVGEACLAQMAQKASNTLDGLHEQLFGNAGGRPLSAASATTLLNQVSGVVDLYEHLLAFAVASTDLATILARVRTLLCECLPLHCPEHLYAVGGVNALYKKLNTRMEAAIEATCASVRSKPWSKLRSQRKPHTSQKATIRPQGKGATQRKRTQQQRQEPEQKPEQEQEEEEAEEEEAEQEKQNEKAGKITRGSGNQNADPIARLTPIQRVMRMQGPSETSTVRAVQWRAISKLVR